MDVQCVICDDIRSFDDHSFEAKRLKNRWIRTYMCPTCDERIKSKTIKRLNSGKFRLYREKKKEFIPDITKETDKY